MKKHRLKSCGCWNHEERVRGKNRRHGEGAKSRITPEYRCWNKIKERCYVSTATGFQYYGGRGIAVCDRWLDSYENFLEDMGRKPTPEHSIDRKDVNGNYEPSNCRWATRVEQANNKRPRLKAV